MIIDANLKRLIQQAIREDVGSGDITTQAIIPKNKKGRFVITAKEPCVICGLAIAEAVFETVDASMRFKPLVNEGNSVVSGKAIAYVEGLTSHVLTAERTALNFLTWLSGIATLTRRFVEEVNHTKAKIMDTRKTIPGSRRLQKYAVRMGGATSHRQGLYDQILIKDNHISSLMFEPTIAKTQKAAFDLALTNAKANSQKDKKIEVEVESLAMLKVALRHSPDIIMLDNMGIDDIREAVKIRDAYRIKVGDVGFKVLLEVSGGVPLKNVKEIAEAGVDMISVGALTHSAPSVDISLETR